MIEALQLAVGTVSMRPYVFAFFAAYLLVAVPHLGWRQVSIYTTLGYLIAFASEYSSINCGFPYGWYYYIDKTSAKELWIFGVPFFDSLSYVFLSYCSFGTALFILSPLKTVCRLPQTLETLRTRGSFTTLLLASFLQVFLDVIIDPVALQGEKWFLGRIYGYREVGGHFGVPVSNYFGWWLTSAAMIFVLQRLSTTSGCAKVTGIRHFPGLSLLSPLLYLSVIIFNISIAFFIDEQNIAISGLLSTVLPLVMVIILSIQKLNSFSQNELIEHQRDFPCSKT